MKEIVITATQRCGSTLLCKDLEATGVFGYPNEYYISLSDRLDEYEDERDLYKRLIRRSRARQCGCLSVKVMADQMLEVCRYYSEKSWLARLFTGEDFKPLAKIHSQAKWISITRGDVVAQAVSREMARQTQVCHIVVDGASRKGLGQSLESKDSANFNVSAKYDFKGIRKQVLRIEKERGDWIEFFAQNDIVPFELSYESICADRGYLYEIAEFCNLELDSSLVDSDRSLVKVGNSVNREWISRFHRESDDEFVNR